MKKKILKRLCVVIMIGMLLTLGTNYFMYVQKIQHDMESQSQEIFSQIQQILVENNKEAEKVKKEYKNITLVRARAAAYMIEHQKEAETNIDVVKKIAELIQVDEIHLFDTDGTIYMGTHPEYYGYNFNSGEQMRYFRPMLSDHSLELCQPITPNTAEGKMMQYSAVWREDGKGIVQVGMEPVRVMEVTRKNELSYIFTLFMDDKGAEIYAADPVTYEILGSTKTGDVGKKLTDIGIKESDIGQGEKGFHASINGESTYGILMDYDGVLLGRFCTTYSLYDELNFNMIMLAIGIFVVACIMIVSIFKYLEKTVIQGIARVNCKLQEIADGNLNAVVDVYMTEEFEELSGHINKMVESILEMPDKLSSALDLAQIPIGAYEYRDGMKRVITTNKVPEILRWSEEQTRRLSGDYILFEEYLENIRKNPVESEESVYLIDGKEMYYLRIESYVKENSVFGVLVDVTREICEKQRIKKERDEDILTGLYCRRAFHKTARRIFGRTEELKFASVIMIDTDGLKMINDNYGHEVGDYYLRGMADILRGVSAPNKLSARLSGDEFAMLIYGCESREELDGYINELMQYQKGYEISNNDITALTVKFSMGNAYYPEEGEDCTTLLKAADRRMYEMKRQKKENPEF